MSVENVADTARTRRPACLGTRETLLVDLLEAMRPGRPPKVLVIFALEGFREFEDTLGRAESQALLSQMTERLERTAGSAGAFYRPRAGEFALLGDPGDGSLDPLLDRAVAALCEPGRPVPVTAAFASVVVPDEASDPTAALRLADARLAAAQPGRQLRERRRSLRPGTQRDRPEHTGGHDDASADSLRAIHGELVEASANALRMRQVDQLLDVAATLTMIADAVRVDYRETGTLQGQSRERARVPLLLKELGFKLAALRVLGGPEIPAAAQLLQEAGPGASNMSTKVLEALDEISVVLAAA